MLALIFVGTAASPSAAVSGTLSGGVTETLVRDTGGTIIITLTADTWVAAGAAFDAQRQNIIDGLDAAASPANGWNNEVRDVIDVTTVVRTSDTVVTITVPATAAYDISTDEIITVTAPATALVTSASNVTATPTLSVTAVANTVGGTSNYIKRKKREDPEALRRAAQAALLRRRKAEAIDAKVRAIQEAEIPKGKTLVYDAQAHRIAKVVDPETQELATLLAAEFEAQEEERRKRDRLAVLLLIN